MTIKDQYENEWCYSAREWAYENDWATMAMVKQADELFPQVLELLEDQDLLQDVGCSRRVYDYCFNDNLSTSAQDVVNELTA